jgi:hypothetical protein
LIQAAGETWRIVPGKEEAVRRLKERHRLKALVVVKEERVLAALECGGGPCNERYAEASGLYTRGIFGLTRYTAVAAFRWNVFVLDPVADIAQAAPLRSPLQIPGIPMPDFQDPRDFKNLTEGEFAPARAAVLRFVATVSGDAVKVLGAK